MGFNSGFKGLISAWVGNVKWRNDLLTACSTVLLQKRASSLASQEIPHILWDPKVHYRINKCPPLVLILSQIDPVHPTSWRSILILSSHLPLGPPSGLFHSGFPTKTLYAPLLLPIRATCPVYLILDFITRTIFGEQYRPLSSSLCSFLHSSVFSSILCPNILLITLFSNTLRLFLISNFRHVLNAVCFLLGNSPASEFYIPTFRNTLF